MEFSKKFHDLVVLHNNMYISFVICSFKLMQLEGRVYRQFHHTFRIDFRLSMHLRVAY
jgi:hypothetical protein